MINEDRVAGGKLRRELAEAEAVSAAREVNHRMLIARLEDQIEQIATLTAERDDLQASFDLRWKADMRAIERWRDGDPAKALTMPDHADLCVWLMEQLESTKPPDTVWWDDLQKQIATLTQDRDRQEETIWQLRNELNQAMLERDAAEEKLSVIKAGMPWHDLADVQRITSLEERIGELETALVQAAAMREALEWIRRTSSGVPGELGSDSQGNCSMRDCDCSNHTARRVLDSTDAGAGLLQRLRDAEASAAQFALDLHNRKQWHNADMETLDAEMDEMKGRIDELESALSMGGPAALTVGDMRRAAKELSAATGPKTRVAASETISASQVEQALERAKSHESASARPIVASPLSAPCRECGMAGHLGECR